MKKLLIICFLWSVGTVGFGQPIDWQQVRNDYDAKYQPTKKAAWLFPMIFEEGGGQRDTIYLGYDEDARTSLFTLDSFDTPYGEVLELWDTSKFNVFWTQQDSLILKSMIMDGSIYIAGSFDVVGGIYPLKIWWDYTAFYSDSLTTFPSTGSSTPRVCADLGYSSPLRVNGQGCHFSYPALMTDTVLYSGVCEYKDSIMFVDQHPDPNHSLSVYLSIGLRSWNGLAAGVSTNEAKNTVVLKTFPNPTDDLFFVKIEEMPKEWGIQLYNLQGYLIDTQKWKYKQETTIRTEHLPNGIYFLKVIIDGESITRKIIVHH